MTKAILFLFAAGCTVGVGAAPAQSGSGSDDPGGPPDTSPDAGPDRGLDSGPVGGSGSAALLFSAYKDTSINLDYNTNIISTMIPGTRTPLATDLAANDGHAITLAFATGECGAESWGGVSGALMAQANAATLAAANIDYVLSTGGAAGSFTCGTDVGFATFIQRWASPHLRGIDFDIEAGQSAAVIDALVARVAGAHAAYPDLRFSLTLATLANNNGATTARSLGAGVTDSFNVFGDEALAAVATTFGPTWPSYLTVNLMTMDFGAASAGACVVVGGTCDMGQSAIQAVYNLHDRYGVPFANIEVTPMIGGNDTQSEVFSLHDVDTLTSFAIAQGLAGYHYWSYDRDLDCPPGSASPTCNSLGGVGAHGFLQRAIADGLR